MTTAVFCSDCGSIAQVHADADEPGICPGCTTPLAVRGGEDVFISYSTAQVESATSLARQLNASGVRFWLAPEYILGGEDFTQRIPDAINQAKVVVFLLSPDSLNSPWVRREAVWAASSEKTLLSVLLGEVALPQKWTFILTGCQWIQSGEALEAHYLDDVVRRVQRSLSPAAAEQSHQVVSVRAAGPPQGLNPDARVYIGPRPFPDGMENYFFGRDNELRHLVNQLDEHPLVLLTSPSGAGKSSLLSAGVVPTYKRVGDQVFSGVRVGRALPKQMRDDPAAVRNIFAFSVIYGLGGLDQAPRPDMTLSDYLTILPEPEPGQRRILILDQFEEIFTQHRDRFAERAEFVEQLRQAMSADPRLRIILAMRQEYIADAQILFEKTSPAYQPRRVPLRRMDGDALAQAIRRPAEKYLTYDDAVIEEILRQLRIVRIVQPDGSKLDQPGEFVELCHLQIVCSKLWEALPNKLERVELKHLNDAAQSVAGCDFGGFVKNALDVFYNDTVVEVANSEETARHGGCLPELIKLGCMKFVTRDGTRVAIQEGSMRTGRLPNWIVKQLADRYLLRIERAGSDRWYELSHDLLAETVAREIDHRVGELLFASDLLERQLEQTHTAHGEKLDGVFPAYADLLTACEPFQMQTGLFEEEAEFILRISIRTGQDLAAWAKRLRQDQPAVRERVLIEALAHPDRAVRSNAARVLAEDPDDTLTPRLAELTIHDSNKSVRRVAARGLLELSEPALFDDVFDGVRLRTADDRGKHVRSASLLRALADLSDRPAFEKQYRTLPMLSRARVRVGAWARRFGDGLAVLPAIFLPAAICAALIAGPFKAVPGIFDWALVQASPGAGKGLFQGIVAGVLWGGLIPVALELYRLIFRHVRQRDGLFRPIGSTIAGLLGGLISSLIVVFAVVGVYSMDDLQAMGWIGGLTDAQRWTPAFFADLFVRSRFGWAHLITGTMLGLGMAMTFNSLRGSASWRAFQATDHPLERLGDAWRLMRGIARNLLPHTWPLLITQAIACAAAITLAQPIVPDSADVQAWELFQAFNRDVAVDTIGDAVTQIVGGVPALVGMCLGLLVLRRGLSIKPRRDAL
ncbi:MAG: TIR domain-containing protein [Planctomycetota bacterium]